MATMKNTVTFSAIVIAVLLLAGGSLYFLDRNHAAANYHCVAGPNEICASDQWVADYHRLKALQDKYKMPTDVEDRFLGMQQRLGKEIPKGFGWDEKKERFVKLELPSPPLAKPDASH